LYIYHMIVVNVMVTFGLMGKIRYLILAYVISVMLAYISTITAGRFSFLKKQKIVSIGM